MTSIPPPVDDAGVVVTTTCGEVCPFWMSLFRTQISKLSTPAFVSPVRTRVHVETSGAGASSVTL
jgi:hypothetical protein